VSTFEYLAWSSDEALAVLSAAGERRTPATYVVIVRSDPFRWSVR
jgi:hypothetical protein